jgi:hypothetical protein
MTRTNVLVVIAMLALAGCGKTTAPAQNPAATVTLKDGSTFSGRVTRNDTATITLQAANGESRTYPMTQVSTVQYDTPASPPPPVASAAQQPPPPAPQESAPVAALRPVPPPESAPAETIRTIPAGRTLRIRNNEAINSQTASSGQTYSGVVAQDVLDAEGRVAIPRGSNATLVVREAIDKGKLQGRSELILDVASVSVGGRRYHLETHDLVEKGKEGVGTNKRTAIFTGGGTAVGSIIGAIAGGGKGAAIGAASGAAAGLGTQAVTRGKAVKVPSETELNFKLEAPVRIREAS